MQDPAREKFAVSRRTFIGSSAATGVSALVGTPARAHAEPRQTTQSMIGVPFERRDTVRVGIMGVGQRGMGMVPLFLDTPGTQITAVCDIRPVRAQQAARLVQSKGRPRPEMYTRGEADYERLLARDDVDLVYVATPWEWHYPMALAALRHAKHVGVETPLACRLDHLWSLVVESEKARRHCMQLENCCYGRTELRVLQMVREGVFGELLHGAGAYIHDLRKGLFFDSRHPAGWRRRWYTKQRGNLYPTHGLGPVAMYMDINRGDRLTRMVSMDTSTLGFPEYRAQKVPRDSPAWRERYIAGDMNVSLLQTAQGRVIRLEHEVSNPRPYSRVNIIGGTRAVFQDDPPLIFIEGKTQDRWKSLHAFSAYEHWLWKEAGDPAHGPHGGMDYVMVWRLIQTMRLGLVPDIDVYDSAAWSAPMPLSHESVVKGGAPVPIPDFTRGRWHNKRPGVGATRPT